jgi:hypothetical protein
MVMFRRLVWPETIVCLGKDASPRRFPAGVPPFGFVSYVWNRKFVLPLGTASATVQFREPSLLDEQLVLPAEMSNAKFGVEGLVLLASQSVTAIPFVELERNLPWRAT